MLFPENSFQTKGLQGIAVKTIKKDISNESNTIVDWIEKGCFDALQKQYLKTIIFGIYLDPKHPNKLVEQYEFSFSYEKENIEVNLSSTDLSIDSIQKNTRNLVRRLLISTQNLEPLPENAYVTMRLFYHDHTPIDYEPPLFKQGLPLEQINSVQTLNIGNVETEHHGLGLKVFTMSNNVEDIELSQQTPNPVALPKIPDEMQVEKVIKNGLNQTIYQNSSPKKSGDIQFDEQSRDQQDSPPTQPLPTTQPDPETEFTHGTILIETINCPCKIETEDFDLIECMKCKSWSHLVCHGYTDTSDPQLPNEFICHKCDTRKLISLEEFWILSLHRRVVYCLHLLEYKSKKKLMADAEVEATMVDWAVKEGYLVKNAGKKYEASVDQARYNEIMDRNLNYVLVKEKISTVINDVAVL